MSSFSQINTNIQSLQAFQNLQDTSSDLAMRRERLTTGKRINSAEDDSAGFAIAKKLEARTRGQSQALKNITDAKSMLSVAEGGLDSQLDILQTQKEKAVQASNDSLGTSERIDIQEQLFELNAETTDIANNAEFNGKKLLNGGGGSSQDLTFQVGAQNGDTFDVSINSAKASDLGTESDSRNGIVFDGRLNNSSSASLTNNANLDSSAPNEFDITVSGSVTGTTGTGTVKSGTVKFEVSTPGGSSGAATITSTTLDGSGTQKISLTTGTTGTNSGSLSVSTATADTGSGIDFSISNSQATEIANEDGSTDITAFSKKSELDVSSSSNAGDAISTVDSAISEVTDQMASIGDAQTRLSFKEANLETTRTNLESARSGIEDADFAREQTEIAKLQILQQTGTAQLAQANAAGQSVLSLLGG